MCGRFNLHSPASDIARQFLPGVDLEPSSELLPRYNIAPTQPIACVVQSSGNRQLDLFRWGLVPSWANDLAIGNKMINARSETAAEKPSFRSAFKSRRCLIPMNGYYEWKATDSGKQPYEFFAADGSLLAVAGLWEQNKKVLPDSQPLRSCTILTTSGNRFTSDIHDRMPVILPESHWDQWLDPEFADKPFLQSLMISAPDEYLLRREVSRQVNNVRNQGESLLQPPS